MEVGVQGRGLVMKVGDQGRGLIMEVGVQGRGLDLRSRLKLEFEVKVEA